MAGDFTQERDILTFKPDIEYEEPDVDILDEQPLEDQVSTLEDARKAVDDLSNSYKAVEKLAELTQKRVDKKVGNYVVNLDPNVDALVVEAIRRSFPEAKDPTKITFEMYKQCLARTNNAELPQVKAEDLAAAKQNPLKTDFSGFGAPPGMNRPEINSPAKIVEPLDMNELQQNLLKQLFELLQQFNIPYIEWRFKRHLFKHKHQS